MIIYIVLLAFEVFLGFILKAKKSDKNKKIFLVVSFIVLTLISGLRTKEVGIDTNQYYTAYKRISNVYSVSDLLEERYEIGFSLLCFGLSRISSDPQLLIFISSLFINFCVLRFIYKNSEDVTYSIFLYITLNFFFSYMNIMRQAIAVAFVLLALENLKQKRYVKYFLGVGIATCFHSSAILAVLYFILDRFEYKKKYNKFLIPIFVIVFVLGRNILVLLGNISPKVFEYIGSDYDVSNYFGTLLIALISFLILYFGNDILKNKPEQKEHEYNFLQKMLVMNVILGVLGMRVNIFTRFAPYFSIFQIVWLPNIFAIMKKNASQYKMIFSIVFILYWLIIMTYRPEWYGAVPYKMIMM